METRDWLNEIISKELMCDEYVNKVGDARSKKQLMDYVLDAKGSEWFQEMEAKGCGLSYEEITKSFASYINGRYVAEYRNEKGNGYTSTLYCCFSGEKINVDTTLCSVLGYTGRIVVTKNNFAKIYLDKNCDVQIQLQDGAKANVEYWKGAKVEVLGNYERVKLTENG